MDNIIELNEIKNNSNDDKNEDIYPKKVVISDFVTGKHEVVDVDKNNKCFNYSRPCLSFIVASAISIATTTFGIALIATNPASTVLVPIGSSLITANLSFWVSPPSIHDT